MTVSFFSSVKANSINRSEDLPYPALVQYLTTHIDAPTKESVELYSIASYDGSKRSDAAVESIGAFVLDFDGGVWPEDISPEWQQFEYILYSTYNHTDEHPKWRAVFPLAKPVPGAEWGTAWAELESLLSAGRADQSCKNPSRIYYRPSSPPNAPRLASHHRGKLLEWPTPVISVPACKPGEDFEARASWHEILEPAGWQVSTDKTAGAVLWQRPGEDPRGDHCARTGPGNNGDRFYNWSSAAGLPCALLTKFGLYAHLHHNGDYKEAAKALAAKGYGTKGQDSARRMVDKEFPRIQVNGRGLHEVTQDAMAALGAAGDIYIRSDSVVRVDCDESGRYAVKDLSPQGVRHELAKRASFYKVNSEGKETEVPPPMDVSENLLWYPASETPFLPLTGISDGPVLTATGTLTSPGYDRNSGILVVGTSFEPAMGTAADSAKWLLEEFLCDFPFDGDSSRAHALALLLAPMIKYRISEPCPMFLVDAPTMGTGKSLFAKVALYAATNEVPSPAVFPDTETEAEKKLHSMLRGGGRVVFLDNLNRTFRSATFESALTSTTMRSRILGVSKDEVVKINATFVATANNASLSADMSRRCVWVRLDAKMEDPTSRTEFRHMNVLEFAKTHRAVILGHMLRMITDWVNAGSQPGKTLKGGYEEWSQVAGGILEHAGVKGFMGNDKALRLHANEEEAEWAEFVKLWAETWGDMPQGTKGLLVMAEEHQLLGFVAANAKNEKAGQIAFGLAIKKRVGRVYGEWSIQTSTTQRGNNRFKLVESGGSGGCFTTQSGKNLYDNNVVHTAQGEKGGDAVENIHQHPPLGSITVVDVGAAEELAKVRAVLAEGEEE